MRVFAASALVPWHARNAAEQLFYASLN